MKASLFTILLVLSTCLSPALGDDASCNGLVERVQQQCAKFLSDVRDFTLLQEMRSGNAVTEQVVLRKDVRTRVETRRQVEEEGLAVAEEVPTGFEVLEIFDGTDGWRMTEDGPVTRLPSSEVKGYAVEHNCWGFSLDHAVAGEPKRIQDRECCVVTLEENGTHYELLLCTRRLVILEGSRVDPDGRKVRWVHSEFKKVYGDFQFPFKTEIFIDDTLASTTGVMHFKVNTGLDDELFDLEKIRLDRGLAPGSVEHGTSERN